MPFLLFSLTAIVSAVVSAISFAFLGHGLGGFSTDVSLVLGILVAGVATYRWFSSAKKNDAAREVQPISFWEWLVVIIFALASARAFLWLIYNDGDAINVLSPNNLGDLSLHIAFIRYLAVVPEWWPASPILVHEPLRYSIGMDLLNALLLLVGVPLEQGLIWIGLIGAALTAVALWLWGRGFALTAFLFNGGLAGVLFFQGLDPETSVAWKNIFLSMFVTQRGLLYALPAGLLLLTTWRKFYFAENQKQPLIPQSAQILLLGAMPLFSVHAFLFLSVLFIGVMLCSSKGKEGFLKMALFAWPLGLLAAKLISGGGKAGNLVAWHPGWMQEGSPLWFWFWNFGIALPLALILVVHLFFQYGPANHEKRAFVWPAALIFLLCVLFRFAPWPWDNMKLMMWSWITIAPFIWSGLIAKRAWWLRSGLCILLFSSGLLSLACGLDQRHGYQLAKRSELDAAAVLLHDLPPSAVIATAPEYNTPVLLLGHPVVCGYEGHLWSHGLPYGQQLTELHSIMMGEPGWKERARALGIAAIYWSSLEKEKYPNSQLPFAHQEVGPFLWKL